MKWALTLALILLLLAAKSASAQFSIATPRERGPIRLGASLDLQLTKFGRDVAVSAVARATLRGARKIIEAWTPELNRRLDCDREHKRELAAKISDINAESVDDSLKITANAYIVSCSFFRSAAVSGNIGISAIIKPVIANYTSVQLKTSLTPKNLGVYAGEIIPVSDRRVTETTEQAAGPLVSKFTTMINQWLNKQLLDPSLQRQVRAYRMQIQTAKLSFDGEDLIAAIGLSGQVSISEVDRQLGF